MCTHHRGKLLAAAVILMILFIFLLFYGNPRLSPDLQFQTVKIQSVNYNLNGPRTILLWNRFFTDERWDFTDGDKSPEHLRDQLNCPIYDCVVTSNRTFLSSVDMFDALLIHTFRPLPTRNAFPALRSPNQLYVFSLMESPISAKQRLDHENYFFNLTMTYRLDSDINWHYGDIVDIETENIIAPNVHPKWHQPPSAWNDSNVWKLWPQKTKSAAWFVSHCQTSSRREKLVAELKKYIDVDVFGKCGDKSCDRFSSTCDQMLDESYKFYLSFENSLCTDYVTEKFYNAMDRFVVPIVFGGANYTRFAPPQSYINAEDFPDVKALADYLKYLGAHREEYMRYFWWRQHYKVKFLSPFCEVCEKVHSITYKLKTQTYRNIKSWWTNGSCRTISKIKF